MIFLLILFLSVLGTTLLGACAESTSTPTPTLTPTPPLTEEWSADGIIKVREYHGSNNYSNFEVHWRSDDQYVYIGMKAKTNGWLSIAVQPGSRMKNADMIFGYIKDGELTIEDLFSTGDFGPHPPDTELGGTSDILESAGIEEGGFTTIEFKRKLDTSDQYDNTITEGTNKIIWAYGSSDNLSTKHSTRGYGEIDL
jgi:hypothetical protein